MSRPSVAPPPPAKLGASAVFHSAIIFQTKVPDQPSRDECEAAVDPPAARIGGGIGARLPAAYAAAALFLAASGRLNRSLTPRLCPNGACGPHYSSQSASRLKEGRRRWRRAAGAPSSSFPSLAPCYQLVHTHTLR